MLRRIVVVRYTLLVSSQPTSLILISVFSSLHELIRFYSPECLPEGGHPKPFPLTSLIMRLQHLTSVCRVWMANANGCISQLAHDELFSAPQGPSGLLCALRCVLPLSVWVFSCDDDSSLCHHFIIFFFSFLEAVDDLGASCCCGFNSCDCCCALQDLRATHTHTHTMNLYLSWDVCALGPLSYLHYWLAGLLLNTV